MHRRLRPGLPVRLLTLVVLLPALLAGLVLPASVAQADGCANLTAVGTALVENFNSLANAGTSSTTPAGWNFAEAGTNANAAYAAGTGSSNAGDTYSFGAASSSERAFGGLQSGSLVPTIGACFINQTGQTLNTLQIAYTGEQWRLGTAGRADQIDFQYSLNATSLTTGTWTDVNALDFVSPTTTAPTGALDGNAVANRTPISSSITGLSIAPGASVWIRWVSSDASGADDGLAVDDVSVTGALGPDVAPSVSTTVPANGAVGVALNANISITFSEPVTLTGTPFTVSCATSGSHAVTVNGGPTTYTLDPAPDFANNELCTVTVAAGVADVDTNDPPDTMAADHVFTFTPRQFRIHDIQGPQHRSSLNGQTVDNVFGIVTLKRQISANPARFGFFIQDTPDKYDTDERTSEAVLVFTDLDPVPGVNVGDAVLVSGEVTEFRAGGASSANLATTEIEATAASIVVQSSGNALPPPTVVGTGGRIPPATVIDDDAGPDAELGTFEPATDGIDFWESLEGMRVQVNNAVATSTRVDFTSSSTQELVVLPDGGAHSNSRSARGGVILRCVPSLPGDVSHCDAESDGHQNDGVDFNPERLFLHAPMSDSPDAPSSPPTKGLLNVPVNVRDSFPGAIVGVLDYNFGNFKLLVTNVPAKADGGLQKEVSQLAPVPGKLTIGSFNVENIDPGDPPSKFASIAGVIVNNMRSPDILGVEEVQDNDGPTNSSVVAADQTYGLLINAIVAAGGPQYQFRQIDPIEDAEGGEPGGNIRVGFLYNPSRVQFVDVPGPGSTSTGNTSATNVGGKPHLNSSPGRLQDPDPSSAVYPGGAANAFNASRRPLVGEFSFQGQTVFVVNNHFNSKGGDQSPFGRFQPQTLSSENQRREQARIVRDFVTSILAIDPAANVVVLGDLNDFHFSRPISILETLEGTLPAAQRLHDLLDTLPENERYTYIFDGNSQSLDGGVLVSNNLFQNASFEYDVVHVNAEFQDQVSDHEAQVVRFTIAAAPGRPEASLTPDLVDFGDVPIGTTPSPTRTAVLTNTGVVPLSVSALTLDGAHASEFAIVSPSAPFVLHAGQARPIVVRFTPTSRGQKHARLVLADDGPGERRVTLRGTGQGPEAAIAPDRVGFGRVLVNTQAPPRTVTIFNTGLASLTVSSIAVNGPEAAAFPLSELPTLPATIPAGQIATFKVGFTPTQRKGYSARIEVGHNATGELRVPLSGQGVLANEGGGSQPRPEANLSPNQVGFGDVALGSTAGPRTVMVFNTGDAPLVVSAIVVDGAHAGDFALTPVALPATVAPGALLSVEVRFTPTARGQRSASLRVADNANGGERRTTLRGVGQGPEASVTPNALEFGQLAVGTSLARSAIVTNTGLAPLHVSSVTISGDAPGDYQVTPAGAATIPSGESLTLTVTCTPSATGNRIARLEVNDDATGERRVNLSCRGT